VRRWYVPGLAAIVVALTLSVVAATPAVANHGSVLSIFSDTSINLPSAITAGPDGALWFTDRAADASPLIGRISTDGSLSTYPYSGYEAAGIAVGSDGAMWFGAGPNSIGRITTAGVVTYYTDPKIGNATAIAAGPDGALWFTDFGEGTIGRITTGGVVSSYSAGSGMDYPDGITAGPDGALWFTNNPGMYSQGSIGRITTDGVVTIFTDASMNQPVGIVTGPDGALWFTNWGNSSIGRITTDGAVSNFKDPSIVAPLRIAVGPDGALWFTNNLDNSIGRITTDGVASDVTGTGISNPVGIVAGPDGALWFTNNGQGDQASSSIGRVTTPVPTVPTITGTPPSPVNDGVPYNFAFAIDGWPVPSASVTSGTLPPGLNLSAAGVISGTPTAGGTYGPITVTATNGIAPDATDTFTMTVVTASPTITGIPPSPVNVGAPYNFAFTVTGAPPPTVTRTMGKLPPGLKLSRAGVMSGTPYQGGTFGPITVTASNGIAPDVSETFTITVTTHALTLVPDSGPPGRRVTVYGGGFGPFESVQVSYKTGLSAPGPASVQMCNALTTNRGTFSCKANIPNLPNAGAAGPHKIVGKGANSHSKAKASFDLQ
jgi:virginiamycin B lyase